MAMPILSDRAKSIDRPTQRTIHSPNTLVKSFDLVSFCYLSKTNEAICQVRDLATGEVRQSLASKLLPISYGKDAYLLELTSVMEGDNNV